MPCIYKITNTLNGKSYIGQTIQNPSSRWRQHCSPKRTSELHSSIHMAIQKYGKENFVFEVLQECLAEELDKLEVKYIAEYNTYKKGYNQTRGGNGVMPADNALPSKPVRQYTLAGEFIAEYSSISEASRETGFSISGIGDCCTGKHKANNGFQWSFAENKDRIAAIKYGRVVSTKMMPVIVYNEEERHIFTSVREAAKFLGINKESVRRRCIGETISTYNGYKVEQYNFKEHE